MPQDTPRKPGHRWTKTETPPDDKGTEFINPLERHGQKGSRWIEQEAKTQTPDTSDLRGSDRRGAVLPNEGEVTESSANRVRRTG